MLRHDGVLEGVVVNNTTAEMAGHDMIHVDPIALESKIVVDATGHDAVVVELLHKRNLYTAVPGNGAMWVSRSEEDVMDRTGEVYPNCFVIGSSRSRRLRHSAHGPGLRLNVAFRTLRSGADQKEAEERITSSCGSWRPIKGVSSKAAGRANPQAYC